jgi:hypothetical protein
VKHLYNVKDTDDGRGNLLELDWIGLGWVGLGWFLICSRVGLVYGSVPGINTMTLPVWYEPESTIPALYQYHPASDIEVIIIIIIIALYQFYTSHNTRHIPASYQPKICPNTRTQLVKVFMKVPRATVAGSL